MADLVGQLIAHYRLDALLGDGGMGSVYRAYDQNLERTVAIKVMHGHFSRSPEFRTRLAQEARTAAQLDHPSIVGIYDFGEHDGDLFIAMEYIAGGSLRTHLHNLQSKQQFLPIKQSFQIAIQIADALDYAHQRGIVHRDVKPSNIILKRLSRPDATNKQPFRAVLTDFGLVKILEGDSLTQGGTTLGTATYMSPEQCEGKALDGRSDLYSLGVVLYELLTNQLPFSFKSLSHAVSVHIRGELPKPPTDLRPSLPSSVDDLVMQSLAKDRENRFASGQQMADAFEKTIFSFDIAGTQQIKPPENDDSDNEVSKFTSGAYQLELATPGRKRRRVNLVKQSVTIGRNADNDIVLPADGVSRYHAKIEATPEGWIVVDMGGINGTWLNESRLSPSETRQFKPSERLEIGPYRLVLISVPPEKTADSGQEEKQTNKDVELRMSATSPPESDRKKDDMPLSVYIARETVPLELGKTSEIQVDILNRGDIADKVSIKVLGLPSEWLRLPGTFVRVESGESVTVPFEITPPRHADTPPGRQRVRIEVLSQQYPKIELAAHTTVILGTFNAFEFAMEPKRIKLPALVRVTIKNTGNAEAEYSVLGDDPARQIRFRGERDQITLEPRQTAAVDLELESQERSWFGRSEEFPFRVAVVAKGGDRQSARGRATISPRMPMGILYGFIFITVLLCILGGLLLVFQGDRFGGISGTTEVVVDGIAATSTARVSGSATAASMATSSAATSAAATAMIDGDRDNDGLSDAQEDIIGTDLDNPDTDSDGLLDGEEVLTWGTQPLIRDTDIDVLLDGDEVNAYGTNPTNPDTDGDGVPDGAEIATGSDPLDANDPPPTQELPSPTASPTETPSPPTETATLTPTPSRTPTPSPTPSSTPTPSRTPTATASPTSTPTSTASLTPTATVEATSEPDCNNITPVIDGTIGSQEWGSQPTLSFAPGGDAARAVEGYVQWEDDQLYLAFAINDPTANDAIDSMRVSFDANNNGGDPDQADRFFQVVRDGTLTVRAGLGSEADGRNWDANYESDDWEAVVGESDGNGWSVEFHIDVPNEMPAMLGGDPFAMMTLVQYTGSLGIWPDGATSNNLATWQVIENMICQ